jgi:hypothetical protein
MRYDDFDEIDPNKPTFNKSAQFLQKMLQAVVN